MPKKRFAVFTLIIIPFLLGSVANAFSAISQEVPVRFTTYTSSVVSFSLDVPDNWKVENPPRSPNPYLVFVAWSPETQVEVTLEHKEFGSLDKFKERVREDITIFPGVTITQEGKTTIDELPAYWFDYCFPTQAGEMQGRLYLFSRNQGFYRIICLASRKNFERYLSTFEHIIQSFTFITDQDSNS